MSENIYIQPPFWSLAEAANLVTPEKLIAHLKQGSITARGRYIHVATTENPNDPSGYPDDVAAIKMEEFRECECNTEKNTLFHSFHHYAYVEIEILKTELTKLLPATNLENPTERNAGGKPPRMTPQVWAAICFELLHNQPDNARAFTRELRSKPEVWNKQEPLAEENLYKTYIMPFLSKYNELNEKESGGNT